MGVLFFVLCFFGLALRCFREVVAGVFGAKDAFKIHQGLVTKDMSVSIFVAQTLACSQSLILFGVFMVKYRSTKSKAIILNKKDIECSL